MSRAKHTPGRLSVAMDGTCSAAHPVLLDEAGEQVCECELSHVERASVRNVGPVGGFNELPERFRIKKPGGHRALADARRLAAAWNACLTISTKQLESPDFQGLAAEFEAYKAGSVEAYGALVESSQALRQSNTQARATIESQQSVIYALRAHIKEVHAALDACYSDLQRYAPNGAGSVAARKAKEAARNMGLAL